MKLGKEIPRKDFNKWIRALRSGKFAQTKKVLQNAQGYCCLGVACEVLGKDYNRDKNGFLINSMPSQKFGAPFWITNIDDDFAYLAHDYLTALNDSDSEQLTFDEIADCLELVYRYGWFDEEMKK